MQFSNHNLDLPFETQTIAVPVPATRALPGPEAMVYSYPLAYSRLRLYKRIVDLCLSTILILGFLSWLLPVLALAVRLDSRGPLFFVQQRRKRRSGTFRCIKLRTMVVNPEADTKVAKADDHRITNIGKWLRLTHLDELPQLFNVWMGDMSLVGPRPYMILEDQRYVDSIPGYARRYYVKPGITGLAQSRGYFGATDGLEEMKARLSLDIEYVQHWSLRKDFRILVDTLRYLSP